jgi:hypothetical protein
VIGQKIAVKLKVHRLEDSLFMVMTMDDAMTWITSQELAEYFALTKVGSLL